MSNKNRMKKEIQNTSQKRFMFHPDLSKYGELIRSIFLQLRWFDIRYLKLQKYVDNSPEI